MEWTLEEGFEELLPAEDAAYRLVDALRVIGQKVAMAESCTGGLLASTLVAVPGASAVFENGFVTYSNGAKTRLLGVYEETLNCYTEYSAETAVEMVRGCGKIGQADLSIAVTGIAGPSGGSTIRPVGLVYIACMYRERIRVQEYRFHGNREEIRRQAVAAALQLAYFCLRIR